jgi:hypothetical protein
MQSPLIRSNKSGSRVVLDLRAHPIKFWQRDYELASLV